MGNSVDPQGLHCLQFQMHLLVSLLYGRATLFKFYDNYSNLPGLLGQSDAPCDWYSGGLGFDPRVLHHLTRDSVMK